MGLGDDLMATGMARGAKARGKRIAFGDRTRIIWGPHSEIVFRHNPNIARPGSEGSADLEWIEYYKGHRTYNTQDGNRWIWHPDKFRAKPGEMFFSDTETAFGRQFGEGFIVIEPNVPPFKSVAVNKQWQPEKYEALAQEFKASGYEVVQFSYNGRRHKLPKITHIETRDFRQALAVLSHARLAIMPEGGLHHGAAAVGVKAVVLFGGFIPPSVTGYDMHVNLTGGAEACGNFARCAHCAAAMENIKVDDVLRAADGLLANG